MFGQNSVLFFVTRLNTRSLSAVCMCLTMSDRLPWCTLKSVLHSMQLAWRTLCLSVSTARLLAILMYTPVIIAALTTVSFLLVCSQCLPSLNKFDHKTCKGLVRELLDFQAMVAPREVQHHMPRNPMRTGTEQCSIISRNWVTSLIYALSLATYLINSRITVWLPYWCLEWM